jgi:hypothetical protein
MSLYSRDVPNQAEFTNRVHGLLLERAGATTVGQLMEDNDLKNTSSVLAAIYLLEEEKKVRVERASVNPDIKVNCLV